MPSLTVWLNNFLVDSSEQSSLHGMSQGFKLHTVKIKDVAQYVCFWTSHVGPAFSKGTGYLLLKGAGWHWSHT
jgi:hypothetical protein